MVLPAFEAIPKEMYLLIGAILGFVGALITATISRRTQVKLAREAHQHQLQLAHEAHQHQLRVETLKLQDQARQEALRHRRSKIEETHEILSKIANDNSQTTSYITWERRMTVAEYHAQYQQQQVEVHRFEMLVALYFPELQDVVGDLPGLTNLFWGYQHLLIHEGARRREEGEEPRNRIGPTEEKLLDYVRQISERVSAGQQRLRTMIHDVLPLQGKE